MSDKDERHLGRFGATTLGVGAIVGGGILALAGVAFATAGPAAIIAFALNGGIAFLTAVSFARLASRYPESGGTYAYAKRVVSIEVAFIVGWVVWFASIVAGVLYALGFAVFAVEGAIRLFPAFTGQWSWIGDGRGEILLALAAIGAYSWILVGRSAGGGIAATVGKVIVFVLLIIGGIWAWLNGNPSETVGRLHPFAPGGALGIVQAMGYTFIALQGFDLIAAVGGEVKDPKRTLPFAMYTALGITLVIYLPLLFVIATVGAPSGGVFAEAQANPEGLVAGAVDRYLGTPGYWLVIGAGILSMLSALHANLYGASRVVFSMARDRTLPRQLGQVRGQSGAPAIAVISTGVMMIIIVLAVDNVAAAGAAASLIFLISFAMVHCTTTLTLRRSGENQLPLLPILGALFCLGLAIFQAVVVPEAGRVVALWLGVGVVLYLMALAPGARVADASAEASDPELARSRGRNPLVLAPIANPASAASLSNVASTVRTPNAGKVVLLSVLRPNSISGDAIIRDAKDILAESVGQHLDGTANLETLFTVASDVWEEIARVANEHSCETVLVGLPRIQEPGVEARLEGLISAIHADVVIVRAPPRWHISEVSRILVPVRGQRVHSPLRARLLASLSRTTPPDVTYVQTLPSDTRADAQRRHQQVIQRLARDEAAGPYQVEIDLVDDPVARIVDRASTSELIVMGMESRLRHKPSIGPFALEIARRTTVPLILLGCRHYAASLATRGFAQAVSVIQKPLG
ncbi:MAG: amino acid permease [Bacteroidetes bacterium]|nr:amino acid permease [Bacteroidota bacterium]MCY4204663.1 amino acid permease [Bacteroidota bacterium]